MTLAPDLADVWEMRPKLRQDVVFLEAPAGAYLRGGDTAFLLKGRSAFRWLVALSPYLTGEHTVGQMCGSLDEGQQRTVATLIRALTSRGFARDVTPRSLIPDPVRQRFARQIEFVDHFADDATGRFQRFRQARVALAGGGEPLLAAALGLLRNGCAHVSLHPEDGSERYRDPLYALAAELEADEVPVDVHISDDPVVPAAADAIVYCVAGGQLPQLLDLARRCHDGGPRLVPVVWSDGEAVLGPSAGVGESPCWVCAQLRLTAAADSAAAAQTWRQLALGSVGGGGVAPVDQVAARMVGNAAAFEVFRVMTGALPADTAASVVLLDLDTLEATRERVLPHPECPICAISSPALPDQAAAPMTDEEVYQRCEILVSPRAGVFTMFTDDPLEQAPLKTARLKLPGPRGPREITAFDVHTVMGARLTAYRVAVRDYLGRIGQVEGAVLATAAELTTTGRTPVPWTALDTATGAVPYTPDQRLRWLPARVLGEAGETVWVPAAVALPFSADGREGLGERTVAGGAVGASLDEVIANGLASALAYRGLVEAIRGQSGLAPLPEADLTTDQDTAMVLRTAHRFGRKPQLFTLTGAAPAHAVLAVLDGDEEDKRPAWTIGVGSSARQARLTALRDLVGLAQVHRFEGIDADLGDPLLSDFDPRTALLAADPAADAPADAEPDTEDMVSSLAARGLAALLVEHTTRDILATQALRGGVVLLWQRPAAS